MALSGLIDKLFGGAQQLSDEGNFTGHLKPHAFKIVSGTHVGLKRTNNEDSYLVAPIGKNHVLCVVADGVGGQQGGEVASRIFCETLLEALERQSFDAGLNDTGLMRELLSMAFLKGHQMVAKHALTNPDLDGMACTGLAAVLGPTEAVCCTVGDSRLYRLQNAVFEQITEDQTEAQMLVQAGKLSPEALSTHPGRNVLYQAIGIESANSPLKPETEIVTWYEGDSLLICSDGLTDMVDDQSIEQIIREGKNITATRKALEAKALENGGRDNCTIIVVQH